MSSIPKIKLTTGRKREKCNLDFDCSTTTNFGIVQPTMAREMIPESKFQVKVSSLVRCAPMPVPTFGRMFLTHRHVFVPYIDVCPQFDSFLSSQPYKLPVAGSSGGGGLAKSVAATSYVPSALPVFNTTFFSRYLLANYADYTIYIDRHELEDPEAFAEGIGYSEKAEFMPLLLPEDWSSVLSNTVYLPILAEAWDDIFHSDSAYFYNQSSVDPENYPYLMPSAPARDLNYSHRPGFNQLGCCRCGSWYVNCDNTVVADDNELFTFGASSIDDGSDLVVGGYVYPTNLPEYIELDNADYVSRFGSKGQYLIAFRLKAVAKRVRTIMQGLGYQFTPNIVSTDSNWLKLFAFYKAWFNLYRPKRDLAFTDTACYDMIKQSELPDVNFELDDYMSSAFDFIDSLGRDCYNYLPQDYFGMSITQPNKNYQGEDDYISTYTGSSISDYYDENTSKVEVGTEPKMLDNLGDSSSSYPLNIQIALKVLKYVNKNTIVGRSIHDYIKAHFGISLDSSHDLETVYEIGSVSIPIEVNDVMSTANTETSEGKGSFIGEYAGRGIGFNKDDNSFEFENRKNFGVWLTLTSLMPRSGYYQGILRENNNRFKFDFYTPEFDALGYDVLLRSEISADYPVSTNHFNAYTSLNIKRGFGFVPRYSYYKVGRNIVNGDLSLRSMKNDMAGYTLDRMLPYDSDSIRINEDSIFWQRIGSPSFTPSIVYDEFRKIDPSDQLGQYNRIFYVNDNREDHFIIHNVFDVKAWLPAKSLTESFDTMSDDDTNVTEMQHS